MSGHIREVIFIRLLPVFVIGLLLAYVFPIPSVYPLFIAMTISLVLISTYAKLPVSWMYRWQFVYGCLLMLLVLISGMLVMSATVRSNASYLTLPRYSHLTVKVTEEPMIRERSIKIVATILSTTDGTRYASIRAKCLLYVSVTDKGKSIRYGDEILCRNTLRAVDSNPNPHAVNYQFILRNKGIYETGYLTDKDYQIAKAFTGTDLIALAISIRNYCLQIIRTYVPDPGAAAVCTSLLLGAREQLRDDLEEAYASAGVIHILAVSGMHVGLIYLLIQFLFNASGLQKRFRLSALICTLLFIWLFALVTGLSSSVVRASAMITFVACCHYLKRPMVTLNILFASAFVLLIHNPLILFDIGFQLSFFAVWGIIVMQPVLYERLHTPNPILDYVVKMVSVSLAAQLFTMPLILYYFNQIPVHFLLANLIVVPVLTMVIYALILLIALSFFPGIMYPVGHLISVIVTGVNDTIAFIQTFPMALVHIRSFTALAAVLLFIAVLLGTSYLSSNNPKYLRSALIALVLIIALGNWSYFQKSSKQYVQVFSVGKYPLATIRNRDKAIVMYPYNLDMTKNHTDRYLKQYFLKEYANEIICVPYGSHSNNQIRSDWFTFTQTGLNSSLCEIQTQKDGLLIRIDSLDRASIHNQCVWNINKENLDIYNTLYIPLTTIHGRSD
ncbi:MAG: ComEC/Rec2 family competence protein [Bacteroidota bacterium]